MAETSAAKKQELLVVVRIAGMVKVNSDVAETLDRLRLRRKYATVVIHSTSDNKGMLEKVKHFVAFGPITEETLVPLIEKRGHTIGDKKIDAAKAAQDILSGKKVQDVGLKPFFRLHPPRGGIDSKLQYPKGVLGNNKEKIHDLIVRML